MAIAAEKTPIQVMTDFLGTAPSLKEIIAYRLPEYWQERAHDLLEKNREEGLTSEERAEMEEFMEIDHIMTLIKAKAHHQLRGTKVTRIKGELRRQVIERAGGCCEYCRIGQNEHSMDFAIDHVIAEKHHGPTTIDNLCLSCYRCNGYKGSDLSSVDWDGTGERTWLYDPRKQNWSEHFQLNAAIIEPLTPEGRVTVTLLRLNDAKRIQDREALIELGLYPCQKE